MYQAICTRTARRDPRNRKLNEHGIVAMYPILPELELATKCALIPLVHSNGLERGCLELTKVRKSEQLGHSYVRPVYLCITTCITV